ncbi:RNA-binding domain-containing protein [Rivularia sp. UHCC 0363]|uniref:RNA-binding domain-containing protein n=1 Tax=Rivularia sp. UHCC 0363 TaxID=3110244 RepID=UPI002B2216B1|nr:RNA-binding domain-containing protein [Rivularia sp. UHCC 0363]MEA5593245.1 RNA-binding domain-containing protein [Rivularia sp. UHCC 0363]
MQTENIHLLLVEDNPRFMEELKEWLQDFGYQNIETASSAAEATQKLNQSFDVLISDMRMEQDDSGFVIVEQVKMRNLSSVVIILTANDTVPDCRNALKMGAWDYISKNMRGNVFEVLHQSIQEAIAYFNRWGNVQNEQWIDENLEVLEKNYWGQYIAVINRTVIDADENKEVLEKQIEERKLRRFLTTFRKIGDFRSIEELIKLSESPILEYKSTLQWDVNKNHKNESLRLSVLKTIAAFLNSDGGTLIIGVEDNGNIFGLEKDLSLLSKNNIDQFEQTIVNLICDRIGASFTQLVKIRFENIEGKDICAVDVKKSAKRAFMKGKEKLEFYIRAGNTSKSIEVPDIYNYM